MKRKVLADLAVEIFRHDSPVPDVEEDGRGYWFGPVEVMADPTGRNETVTLTFGDPVARLQVTPHEARRIATDLLAAADFAEGAD